LRKLIAEERGTLLEVNTILILYFRKKSKVHRIITSACALLQ